MPNGVAKNATRNAAMARYSAACAGAGACSRAHSAMVGLARLIGSVW